jgi:hypothetical protein
MNESAPQKLARMLQVVRGLEADIGAGALSKSEKLIFTSLADLSTPNSPEVNINNLTSHPDLTNLPTPTLYKCLRDLQTKGMIEKVGTERSGTYKLA